MKLVEKVDATDTLAQYMADIQSGPVIVTEDGCPVAALVPIANADLETVSLSTNQKFLDCWCDRQPLSSVCRASVAQRL